MPGTPGRSGGSNRKSAARRELLNGSHRRSLAGKVKIARPILPSWLTDPVAAEAWARIVGLLEDRGMLSEGDADAVLLAAMAEAEYRSADGLIAAEGLVVNGRAHPLIKARADAWKRWSAALSRLGLDPITRGRIDPPPVPAGQNPFAAYRT